MEKIGSTNQFSKELNAAVIEKNKVNTKMDARQDKLILCTKDCRYNVIKRVCRDMDIKYEADETADWDIYWSDIPVLPEKISKL